MTPTAQAILAASAQLAEEVDRLSFAPPITHVYNPLRYAWGPWASYVARYAASPRRVLFLGMNPGPWGMAQTGVPFGEVASVRDWLGVTGDIQQPPRPHPKKPVTGWACRRSEVSGQRLWGWIQARFGTPEAFFAGHFVLNYCPLLLTAATATTAPNITPDKLPAGERVPLYAACDTALRAICEALEVEWVIGVGQFAEQRAQEALSAAGPRSALADVRFGRILHPSPASPTANRGFAAAATAQMVALGLW